MQWSDIKNTPPDVGATETSVQPIPAVPGRSWKWWGAIGLAIIVIIGGIVALLAWRRKKSTQPVLPAQQLQEIGNFLDQNPPVPLTPSQATTVDSVVSQPVTLDDQDTQALQAFFNR